MSQQQSQPHNNTNNSIAGKQRNNGKGKFLTRSHAMHECTSPPQTPTPRTSNSSQSSLSLINEQIKNHSTSATTNNSGNNKMSSVSPITVNSNSSNNNNNNNSQTNAQQTTTTAPNLFATNGNLNATQLDLEFPKLTPPKSKSPRNHNSNSSNNANNVDHSNNSNHSNDTMSGNEMVSLNGSGTSSSPISPTTAVSSPSSQNDSQSNNDCSIQNNDRLPSSQFASWSKQQQQHSANELDANNIKSSSSCSAAASATNPNKNSSEKSSNNSNGSNSNAVSCTILLNDVEKKCDLLLTGGNSSQPNCIDEQFSDNNKDNKSNADECSNSVEFVYKKNRNSAVTKMGGGGGKTRQQKHNNQSANSNIHSNNNCNNSNNNNNVVGGGGGGGGTDTMQNASNGCQSDYLSVESSTEHFTDQSGVDLLQFFKITLNKNAKDRYMLLRVEKELAALAQDQSRDMIKFPTMSSYNRMLIHRVAAWFGMEHNVDSTVQCVIVNTTKSTRLPEIRFKSLLTDTFSDEAPSRKSILKRDAHSFEEYRQGLLECPDRGNMLDRKAKSFEEREQEYEKAKRRIFKDEKNNEIEIFWDNISRTSGGNKEHMMRMNKMSGNGDNNNQSCHKDNNDDDTNETHKLPRFADLPNWIKNQNNNRLLRVQSSSNEQRMDSRPSVEKSHSFGGYGPQSQHRLARGDSLGSAKSTNYSKHDSCNSQPTWRLSSSSSGYKTKPQSLRSGSMTPSPSYSSENHTPEPMQSLSSSGIVWAVTDMSSVPKGSVLIDPQTLKPIVNQDGSIYHFDPSNLPPGKLQIANASPATSPLPVDNANAPNRKRNRINVTEEHLSPTTDDKESQNSTPENSRTIEIETIPESEVKMPEPTKTISMNSLLSPLSKVYSETKDNNLNRIVNDNGQEAVMHPTVKNQSTSPLIPNDSEDYQLTTTGDQSTNAKVDQDNTSHPTTTESKETSVTPNQTINDKPQLTTSSAAGSHATAGSHAAAVATAKKDEIKILPAVVPVLGYTSAAAPNLYSPIETGVQLFTGAQPTQSTAFPTTYQQGLDGSIYAIPQPMIYGYPTVENDYHGGIFLPMYDQTNAQLPANAQPTDHNPNTSDYRRNCGIPLAFFEPQTQAMAVLPVAYPTTTTTASPYGPAHNLYQGQIVYTSDQYNPATATNSQVSQYINYPVSYTYPYNGTAYPYWGQAMTSSGIDPHQHLAQIRRTSNIAADNSTITTQITDHHVQHIPNNLQPSSHLIHQTKNHQLLLSTPNDNNTKQISNNNIDDTEPKDNSNHSNATTIAYERKKNPQNPNRKPFLGNSYRANNNTNVHYNSNASTNNQTTIHSSSSALHAGIRKAMNRLEDDITKRIDDGNKKAENDGNKKIGLQRHQSMAADAGGNNHMYSSGAGHHHTDTNSTPPTYDRANSSQNSDKRQINHNKPLIATLPIMSHYDRPRAPRPKPLDLRRSVSNRNTPSTNSTESNNSPNSIVSNDQPNTPNHSQQQSQQHTPVQKSPSYVSNTVTSPMVNQSGMQQNLGARVVRMYHSDLVQNANDSLASSSSALCGEPFAYNPHSGMYIKLGKTYITHSMAFPNKAQQNDVRQSLPPITGIYPTMNMMLGYPAARQVGPRPSHINQNYHKNNRTPR